LQRVQSCLVSCSGSFLNGSKLITAPLFTKLSTDVDSGVLEVLINKELVNEYLKVDTAEGGKGEFTVINLLKFIGLKKKASKALYCLLSQYQGFGLVKLTVEDWKKALFVPKNTVNSRFFERYMSPAIEELKASGLFTNLKLTKNSKRGAKGITSCQINYKKVGAKQLVHDMLEEKTATQSAPREAIQPTIPVEEPKEPQKAPLTTVEASAYALDAFGTPITKSEYEALSKDLKQLCLILEGV
ncbi:replication initiation protein, partial [Enterococcus gallinarum]